MHLPRVHYHCSSRRSWELQQSCVWFGLVDATPKLFASSWPQLHAMLPSFDLFVSPFGARAGWPVSFLGCQVVIDIHPPVYGCAVHFQPSEWMTWLPGKGHLYFGFFLEPVVPFKGQARRPLQQGCRCVHVCPASMEHAQPV